MKTQKPPKPSALSKKFYPHSFSTNFLKDFFVQTFVHLKLRFIETLDPYISNDISLNHISAISANLFSRCLLTL